MKKYLFAIVFALATVAAPVTAQAHYYYNTYYGVTVSNVCRYGGYYQYVPYYPVGYSCYMSSWNLYGTMSME